MATNHLTLTFPMKSPADAAAVTAALPTMMPDLFKALDAVGSVHYSRFTLLSDKTLLYLADFDGEFAAVIRAIAAAAGAVFDAILAHVTDPPPSPVAAHAEAFVDWAAGQLVHPLVTYCAYPDVTVSEIKGLAASAGVEGASELRPFLVILPARSRLHFIELQLLVRTLSRKAHGDFDKVGTPHMVQILPLEDNQTGFFTVYDGAFEPYIADFTRNIGGLFDLLFKFTKDPPPSPCRKHLQEFIAFAAKASRDPIGFYQAYPGLSNQDIHALIADGKTA